MTWYKMRRTRGANTCACKVPKDPKLRGAQRSPALGLRSTDFHAPENLIFSDLPLIDESLIT